MESCRLSSVLHEIFSGNYAEMQYVACFQHYLCMSLKIGGGDNVMVESRTFIKGKLVLLFMFGDILGAGSDGSADIDKTIPPIMF